MSLRENLMNLIRQPDGGADRLQLEIGERSLALYPRSPVMVGDTALLFMGRGSPGRRLYVVAPIGDPLAARFEGTCLRWAAEETDQVRRCRLTPANAAVVRELLDWTRPRPLGLASSFGLGDRLGVAGPAHLRAMRASGFAVVLAQQSIRELERTERTPTEVLDAASWAVLQEGWRTGFGADADHLKNPADVNRMAAAGYTMFTIDPGDHVVDAADAMSASELEEALTTTPWDRLETTQSEAIGRYEDRLQDVGGELRLEPDAGAVRRAWLKYGAALAHTAEMARHIATTMGDRPFEIEVSVDETASVTSPFEHFLVASELARLGIRWVGLAPRFVGAFEKGVDFRGDLDLFRSEYRRHSVIADALGPYKISIHSGSDKFSVYREIGRLGGDRVHVKTAGTSYLEALRTVAECAPDLFREVLEFARSLYEDERRTYHVSAELERVPAAAELDDAELPFLLDDDDARQVLHVTFGRVLTEREGDGRSRFKSRILSCLDDHEEIHENHLERHFSRHVEPFASKGGSA
jgi:hypothetical protein